MTKEIKSENMRSSIEIRKPLIDAEDMLCFACMIISALSGYVLIDMGILVFDNSTQLIAGVVAFILLVTVGLYCIAMKIVRISSRRARKKPPIR